MTRKDFGSSLIILTLLYLTGTLLYFSQMFLFYDFFESGFITQTLSGWAYLAQAAGICVFILPFTCNNRLPGRRSFQIVFNILLIPVIAVSVITESRFVLLIMMFVLNIIVGIQTAYAFSLISSYVSRNRATLCFASAYSIGGIGVWLISLASPALMTSLKVVILTCILVAITSKLIYSYKYIKSAEDNSAKENVYVTSPFYICAIIAVMSVITALGSNDPVIIAAGAPTDFLTTRLFYAAGLITAALIFDKSQTLGSITAIASILYPFIVIMLYSELPMNIFIIGLTDTFVGFFAVFRAGIFFNLAARSGKNHLAAAGLCVSRVAEGVSVILINQITMGRLASFIISGVLYVILIIHFCLILAKGNTSRKATVTHNEDIASKPSFAQLYDLTRREEEIAYYIYQHKTNGEIAGLLCLSESTVRFHVSNLLKKTGMKNRNEIGREYQNFK